LAHAAGAAALLVYGNESYETIVQVSSVAFGNAGICVNHNNPRIDIQYPMQREPILREMQRGTDPLVDHSSFGSIPAFPTRRHTRRSRRRRH